MSHIYLIGFMGAGKSTVGRRVAARTGRRFADLDDLIERRADATVAEIFAREGESGFRELESEVLRSIAEEPPMVVACGGGVVISDENRVVLKRSGVVIYLKVDAAEALARISDKTTRPLLAGGGGTTAATSLLAAREALYAAVSDVTVDTAGRSIEQVVDAVLQLLAEDGD